MVGEIEFCICATDTIVTVAANRGRALTIDEDGPDVRSLKNVALHAQHRELLAWNADTRYGLAQLASLYLQQSNVIWTNLAGDFHAVIDGHGRAVVSQADAPGEESLVFSLPAKKKNA